MSFVSFFFGGDRGEPSSFFSGRSDVSHSQNWLLQIAAGAESSSTS
jgi:hypothetical protein